MSADAQVSELRLVVTADDWDAAVRFYGEEFGLEQLADFSSPDGRVVLFSAGRATLEIVDAAQAEFIDRVEVGRRVAGPIRVAFEVRDTAAVTDALATAGASVLAPATRTPWDSFNSRLGAPGGLQLTLFQELDEPAAD